MLPRSAQELERIQTLICSTPWAPPHLLADRGTETYLYDGVSIATKRRILYKGDFEFRRRSVYEALPDYDLCHEVGHWLVADAAQRTLPELGLPLPFDPGAHIAFSVDFQRKVAEGCLTFEESRIQESAAYMLGNAIARFCEIDIPLKSLEENATYRTGAEYERDVLTAGVALLRKNGLITSDLFFVINCLA